MTQIKIKTETWEELNKLKKLGDTFDDVISRLINNEWSEEDEINTDIERK